MAYGTLSFHWDILFCKIATSFYCFNCKTCAQGERRGTTYHLLYLQLRKPLKMSLSELMWWRLSRIMTTGRSAPLLSALHCSAKFARYCRRSFSRMNKNQKQNLKKTSQAQKRLIQLDHRCNFTGRKIFRKIKWLLKGFPSVDHSAGSAHVGKHAAYTAHARKKNGAKHKAND